MSCTRSSVGGSTDLLRRFLVCLSLAVALLPMAEASAQLHRATDPVMTPASAYLLQDDAFAAEVNPALIGLLPSFSAAYLHAEVDAEGSTLGRGDALHIATPLFLGLSAGLSLHSIRPHERAFRPLGTRAERAMAVLSLAFAPSERFSIGLSGRAISSSNPVMDGLGSIDVGMALRPSPVMGLRLSARDLFISREGFGTSGLNTGTTFEAGLTLRPLGTKAVMLDGSVVMDTSRNVAGRAGAAVQIPGIGVVSALGELEPIGQEVAALRGMLEFVASFGHGSAGFGAVSGDGFGTGLDWYAFVRADGYARSDRGGGQPVVLDVEVTDLSPRALIELSMLLHQARSDRRVAGVLLRPRDSDMSSADAQEIRLLLSELRRAGKITACHLEDASGAEFYACAGSDEIAIDPAGSVRLMGTGTSVLLFGETLRKLHVKADFLRIGEHKSAPEQYTNKQMSEVARAQLSGVLDDVHHRTLGDLALDLEQTPQQVADAMDQGPYLAASAIASHLVDVAVDGYELSRTGTPLLGDRPLTSQLSSLQPDHFAVASRIGVVLIEDTIVDGESTDVPLLGLHASGSKTIVKAIEGLAADPTVRAIVLRIDSPGGAVLASDQIWRAVRRARARKPVVASMGRVAASGGYYVASAADEIWADPATLTGSIGIFFGKVDVSELAEELGVGVELMRRGKRAQADSIFRPFTADERAALADTLRRYYRLFLERVAEGRGMTVEQVDAVGRGRIFSGDAAKARGLVDHLGGYASALARAQQLAGLAGEPDVVVVPEPAAGLVEMLLAGAQLSEQSPGLAKALPPVVRQTLFSLFGVLSQRESAALALLPFSTTY